MYGYESWMIKKRLHAEELMSLNCGAEEVSWESLGDQPSQRNQPWIFIGRTNAEAEAPIFWPADVKNWLIWKDPDAGQDWGQEEKGMTEDAMVGWHHWPDGMSLSKLQKLVMDKEAWNAAVRGVAKSQTRLSNWTELDITNSMSVQFDIFLPIHASMWSLPTAFPGSLSWHSQSKLPSLQR